MITSSPLQTTTGADEGAFGSAFTVTVTATRLLSQVVAATSCTK